MDVIRHHAPCEHAVAGAVELPQGGSSNFGDARVTQNTGTRTLIQKILQLFSQLPFFFRLLNLTHLYGAENKLRKRVCQSKGDEINSALGLPAK